MFAIPNIGKQQKVESVISQRLTRQEEEKLKNVKKTKAEITQLNEIKQAAINERLYIIQSNTQVE
jgi:hypothetical protein